MPFLAEQMVQPKEATVAVTSRCNLRCAMCNIWKEPVSDELKPEDFLALPSALRTINVTGGEPFLRKDIVDVVRRIHEAAPRSRIVISTNGFLTERIVEAVAEMMQFCPRLGIGVSIDGIGEIHDRIRGVEGAFERAVETVKRLKAIGLEDLRIGMTILPENQHCLVSVFELAEELGVEFTTTIAHNSGIYFKKTDNTPPEISGALRRDIRTIMQRYLVSFEPKRWFRAFQLAGLLDPEMRSRAAERCEAGSRFFYLDSHGVVYPCIVLDAPMGRLGGQESFQALFGSREAESSRRRVRGCRQDCWMVCNIRSYIMTRPWIPVLWIARNKVAAHIRRSSSS